MSAPRTRAEAEAQFMANAKAFNSKGRNASGGSQRRTLQQFAQEMEDNGVTPDSAGDVYVGDGVTTARTTTTGQQIVAMPARKLPRPEPLPEEINIDQESARSVLNITMKDRTVRRFVVYDVPYFRADEFVFLERQIGKLREGFADCDTMQKTKELRDQIVELIAEEAKIVMPEMTVEVLRELGPRQYQQVSKIIERIGGEVVGLYDLSDPQPEEADPNGAGVAEGSPDTMYPNGD